MVWDWIQKMTKKEDEAGNKQMNELEKEETIGSIPASGAEPGEAGRSIPVTDQEAIERGESFSDALDQEGLTSVAIEETLDPKTLQKRIADLEERLVRSLADYDNLRKRSARQMEELTKQATDGLILELLEVLDNVVRAEHAIPASGGGSTDVDALQKGIALIHQQLSAILTRRQIDSFPSVDQPFDAKLHEALMRMPDPNRAEGLIVMEIQRGYKQGDRIIRHAKVGVSSGSASA